MAVTFTTAQYDLQADTRANHSRLLTANVVSGGIEVLTATYTTTTGVDEAATDIIKICKLPIGSIVIPALSSVFSAVDLGTSIIIDIGYAGNPDAFADGINISAVGLVNFCSGTAPSAAIAPEPTTTADIYATYATATSPDPGLAIIFTIAYKVPK